MGFQSTLNTLQGFGVIGEFAFDGPRRVQPLNLNSDDAANNVVGRAFFFRNGTDAGAGAVGTIFAGILGMPKEYASRGTVADGSLAPTLTLANDEVGQFVQMGEVVVALPGIAAIGDPITYSTTTGALDSIAGLTSFTGVIAVTTGILTVSALAAGGYLAAGAKLTGTGVPVGTVITEQLTGTAGSNGTYKTNITVAVASTTMEATNNALASGAGYALVPNAYVSRYAPDAVGAQLAVIRLTN